jgi:predicted nuclease of predicted toxin-antitoxin system
LVDECLPPSLAEQLSAVGHDAVSVVGIGLAGSADGVVMQAARDQKRVLVSADTDFGELLARSNDRRPSLVLFRGAEVDAKALAQILLANLVQIAEPLDVGAIVVLLDDRIRVRYLPLNVEPGR